VSQEVFQIAMKLIKDVNFDKNAAVQKLANDMMLAQEAAEDLVERAFEKWSDMYAE